MPLRHRTFLKSGCDKSADDANGRDDLGKGARVSSWPITIIEPSSASRLTGHRRVRRRHRALQEHHVRKLCKAVLPIVLIRADLLGDIEDNHELPVQS